jgi:hypothetical protein
MDADAYVKTPGLVRIRTCKRIPDDGDFVRWRASTALVLDWIVLICVPALRRSPTIEVSAEWRDGYVTGGDVRWQVSWW